MCGDEAAGADGELRELPVGISGNWEKETRIGERGPPSRLNDVRTGDPPARVSVRPCVRACVRSYMRASERASEQECACMHASMRACVQIGVAAGEVGLHESRACRAHGLDTWPEHMACTHGLHTWPARMACTHGLHAWPAHMACTRGLHTWPAHMAWPEHMEEQPKAAAMLAST